MKGQILVFDFLIFLNIFFTPQIGKPIIAVKNTKAPIVPPAVGVGVAVGDEESVGTDDGIGVISVVTPCTSGEGDKVGARVTTGFTVGFMVGLTVATGEIV